MGMVFSKIRAATGRLTLLLFTSKFSGNTAPSGIQEGGFTQKVHIYSRLDSKVIKRGMVLIDPGNYGPNLITDDAMRHVHGQPARSGPTIRTYDGEEKKLGGKVELCFSGPGPKIRYYTETFCHVPYIVDGIDMVLNHDFYVAVYPDRVPPMLMIRKAGKKVSEDQKRQREARERRQEENAQWQEAERREELRAADEKRKAEEARNGYHSNHSSGGNSGSSGY